MSERATAYSLPPQTTSPSTGNELAVRPKVLRRPAHFNARTVIESPTPTLIPLNAASASAEKPAPAFRAWQDDGKFAGALLAIVILVNLIVSLWLSVISPTPVKLAPTQTITSTDAAVEGATVHVLDSNSRVISEQ